MFLIFRKQLNLSKKLSIIKYDPVRSMRDPLNAELRFSGD